MMYVWRATVDCIILGDNKVRVGKTIIRYRVIKTGREYLTLSPYPASYGDMGTVRVPLAECYTDRDQASAEADRKAAVLALAMHDAIRELNEPASTYDRLVDVTKEPEKKS